MAWWKKLLFLLVAIAAVLAFAAWKFFGSRTRQVDTAVTQSPLKAERVQARGEAIKAAAGDDAGQILFGDLHVHTTWSVDAFMWSLPMMGGEGTHPPADACDFARYCSQLDFYSLTDHAESLNPRTWEAEKESIRQCNAVATDGEDQDLFAFTGFEWTQIGNTPEEHYGHKNVIFKHTDDARLPARPIGATGLASKAFSNRKLTYQRLNLPIKAYPNHLPYLDLGEHIGEISSYAECPTDVPTKDLPLDCRELAATPAVLYDKLDQWGFDSLVIPHGTTWGFYTPRDYTWDKQIATKMDDPARQRLVEVFSGHGNSEEYRDFKSVIHDGDEMSCPEPTQEYEPCCHRAGEIIRSRCDDADSSECEVSVKKAQQDFLTAGVSGYLTVPGADIEDWGECGQCKDCFEPAYNYRPQASTQYMMAKGNFDEPEKPKHQTLGFIASSDNHSARPGTGYKEFARKKMTEARGSIDESWYEAMFGEREGKSIASVTIPDATKLPPWKRLWFERQASFFITGGLVAVHTQERSRDSIWDALSNRNVYGTSGARILLWFDVLNSEGGKAPMGSSLAMSKVPKFEVKAAGAFEQMPGCPEEIEQALGEERIDRVCAGECYNPGTKRHRITQIEVVRVRRQMNESEAIGDLVEDPWMVIPCPEDSEVCTAQFEDTSYAQTDREVVYYVRAIQEPTLAVNAGGLRCTGEGADEKCEPCYGDYRTPSSDDCLTQDQERAWSSPIYLHQE